jgi:sugar/nucleoside kinase (ribokinase family)
MEEIFPSVPTRERTLFVDLADPEKRTKEDLVSALQILSRFQERADVILGLNLKESTQAAEALGLPRLADPEPAIAQTAAQIRDKLKVGCVVIHPRKGASAASRDGAASFAGPFVQQPTISTGAGDHFNAGFALGQMLGFTLEESLCAGVGTSGYYVRAGVSPSAPQLAEFIAMMPEPES